jgi:SAM-dependent methyltransferase
MGPGAKRLKKDSTHQRWERAQAAELDWWKHWRRLPFYRDHSFPDFWSGVVRALLGDVADSCRGVIVEVGCGPHGVVRYLFGKARFKLGMDPLMTRFDERPYPDGSTSYVEAVGEQVPLGDDVADLVFCVNVLDHVADPMEILREMKRILKPSGRLVLEVHTFPRLLVPFLILDRPHTSHWSQQDLQGMVEGAGYTVLQTRAVEFPIDLPWMTLLRPWHWQYVIAKLFVRLSYVCCRKV